MNNNSAKPRQTQAETPKHAANGSAAQGRPRTREDPRQPSMWRELRNLVLKIAAIVLAFVLISALMFGFHRVLDNSMSPAIQTGDIVSFNRWDTQYVAGDVLVLDFEGQRQVRRVVAVAGDTVDIIDRGLLINGALQYETKASGQTQRYDNQVQFPLVVGEHQVFTLADFRENATDSRVYGAVDVSDTLGTLWLLFRTRDI